MLFYHSFLRGLTKGVNNLEEIDVNSFAAAFQKAVESAYKAVMKPKEGTILTVAKGAATRAKEVAEQSDDLEFFFKEVVSAAEETLKKTPEMLPVLKQAGVVDSGGQGLVEVLKGALDAFQEKRQTLYYSGSNSKRWRCSRKRADRYCRYQVWILY